jgi:hypothetical protein
MHTKTGRPVATFWQLSKFPFASAAQPVYFARDPVQRRLTGGLFDRDEFS